MCPGKGGEPAHGEKEAAEPWEEQKERREPLEKEKPWVEEGLAAQIGFRVSEASGLVTREEVWT